MISELWRIDPGVRVPVEATQLFRADVLRSFLAAFILPERVAGQRPALLPWAELFSAGQGIRSRNTNCCRMLKKGTVPLSDRDCPLFQVNQIFRDLLGYTWVVDNNERFTSGARLKLDRIYP